jgi:predicted aminopeptidase
VNSSSIAPGFRTAVLIVLAASSSGCYLLQSAHGQMSLMARREPIARVLARPSTPPAIRQQLERVNAIREFAVSDLDLPDNGSYRSYADVGRPYVVWNVFAAPEFSVNPKEWCYLIVGCVAYRGYFVERRARAYARTLRARGMDVAVGGVAAYSTLGHFDDPIVNTMLGWDEVELASIIFHELTHQEIYVAGDSSFNEALATFVEEEGVRRWLTQQGRRENLANYERQQARIQQVMDLLGATREQLRQLYSSGMEPGRMREAKRAAFADLQAAYARLQVAWGSAPYQAWFAEGLNNAHLVSVSTYRRCVPGFARMLELAGGDLRVFFQKVRTLARLDKARRDAAVCGPG